MGKYLHQNIWIISERSPCTTEIRLPLNSFNQLIISFHVYSSKLTFKIPMVPYLSALSLRCFDQFDVLGGAGPQDEVAVIN